MRAVLLDGSIREEMAPARDASAGYLREHGYEVEAVKLRDLEIGDCTGCFGCWTRTPGRCVSDDAAEVTAKLASSDMVVLLSPIIFGGYSYHIKKVLDRSICVFLPFFKNVEGKMRHPRRYPIKQRLVVIGLLSQRDEEKQKVFSELVKRNSLNFQPVEWSSALVFENERPELWSVAVREALQKAGVKE